MKFSFLTALILSLILIGCTKKSDQYYMDLGNTSLNQKNYAGAASAFSSLVTIYPSSELAPDAIFKMATLYQNQLIKTEAGNNTPLTREQSLKKASDLFRNVFDKYSQSPNAPKALFLSGFILSNDLKDYADATATFNLFLKQFPQNELASSVKEELNNMGLTPEEILLNKKTAQK